MNTKFDVGETVYYVCSRGHVCKGTVQTLMFYTETCYILEEEDGHFREHDLVKNKLDLEV